MANWDPKGWLWGVWCFLVIMGFAPIASAVPVTVEVNWPNWSSENQVVIRDPSGTILQTVCDPVNCANGNGNSNYSNSFNYDFPEDVNYIIDMTDSYGDGWNGAGAYVRIYSDGNLAFDDAGPATFTKTDNFDVASSGGGGGGGFTNTATTPASGTIINSYHKVNSLSGTSVAIDSTIGISGGDRGVLIQMKGATINLTDTASHGDISSYASAGRFEYVDVASVSGSTLILETAPTVSFQTSGYVQFVRVPIYDGTTLSGTVSASPWDGDKGGVVAIDDVGTLTLAGDIDVTGLGFAGGAVAVTTPYDGCVSDQNNYTGVVQAGTGNKGEGITAPSAANTSRRGHKANGGGGGNITDAGGGGGANYGYGGLGGRELDLCDNTGNFGGLGGQALDYSTNNRIFFGGGAGSGSEISQAATGGDRSGGGIILIRAKAINNTGGRLISNGLSAIQDNNNGADGGAAAGTIAVSVHDSVTGAPLAQGDGGDGGDEANGSFAHGTGGGGGGGSLWLNGAVCADFSYSFDGGTAGTSVLGGNVSDPNWGAFDGGPGACLVNFTELPLVPLAADTLDYSDGPSTYGDATHIVVAGIQLGSNIDADSGSLASSGADGDGADDDGLTIPSLTAGAAYTLQASVTGSGTLYGWMDFDGNGLFDTDETITGSNGFTSTGGTIDIPIHIPETSNGTRNIRIRYSSDNAASSPTGAVIDGEVEDFQVSVGVKITNPSNPGTTPAFAQSCDAYDYTGADQSITVPNGAINLGIKLWGGGGGHEFVGNGYSGAGGYTEAQFGSSVISAGDTLTLVVGAGGNVDGRPTEFVPTSVYGFGSVSGHDQGGGLTGLFSGAGVVSDTDQGRALAIAGGGAGYENSGDSLGVNGGNGNSATSGGQPTMRGSTDFGPFLGGLTPTAHKAGGGGGYYGGGRLAASDPYSNVFVGFQHETAAAAGGSGYVSPAATAGQILSSSDGTPTPPNMGDSDYVSGTGIGSTSPTQTAGGNGRAVLCWDMGTDYSDALGYGDATHIVTAGLQLGANIDADSGSMANADATGDDANGNDDEDGVSIFPALTEGDSGYSIPSGNISATGTGTLHAWIDFNSDGTFAASEHTSVTVTSGSLSGDLTWSSLPAMSAGTTISRFRLTSDSAVTSSTPANAASDGEVEDYQLTIDSAGLFSTPMCSAVPAVSQISNGSFTNGSGPSWTNWTATSNWSGIDTAHNNTNSASGTLIQTGLSGLSLGPSSLNGTEIHLSLWWRNGNPAASSGVSTLIVSLDGTEYARATSTTDGGAIATASYSNGASGSQSNFAEFTTTPWEIELPSGISSTGDLTFTFNGGINAGDDYELDDVALYTCAPLEDYSDAPVTYGDATHVVTAGIQLGATIDVDTGSLASVAASGDDSNGSDDEDGISEPFPSLVVGDTVYAVPAASITATGTGVLHGWIDFNNNGIFDSSEHTSVTITAGSLSGDMVWSSLPAMTAGNTFARFRLTSDTLTNLDASTAASDGEVEDYQVAIEAAPAGPLSCPAGYTAITGAGNADTVTVTALNSAFALGVPEAAATPASNANSARLTSAETTLILDMSDIIPENAVIPLTIAKNNSTADYSIALSVDNSAYTVVESNYNTGTEDSLQPFNVSVPAGGARYVRFQRNAGSLWVGGLEYSDICQLSALLSGSKTVSVWDPNSDGLYAIPGNDVVYVITGSNIGGGATDPGSVLLIDVMPADVEFYNADMDDGGPETDPVAFSQSVGAGLLFNYVNDVGYSKNATKPTMFSQCNASVNSGYDAAVTYICFNPKGALTAGDPDPEFTFSFRARIK